MVNSGQIFSHSTVETHKIKRIEFGILNSEQIIGISVAEITHTRIYDDNGQANHGGLSDPRMGIMDRGAYCETCQSGVIDCPGHFGHIVLAKPIWHIGFLEKCVKVLQSVCFNCSKLLINTNSVEFRRAMKIREPKKRQQAVMKICHKVKKCGDYTDDSKELEMDPSKIKLTGCDSVQPKFMRDGLKIIVQLEETKEESGDRKRVLSADEALKKFKGTLFMLIFTYYIN